jgi:acetyltransferase-like isoleucine patch superfamily enzyme|tara:strand:- start:12490 stop:12984 length:495 start_codon:yes stop_codon:yes gene_type:complete
VKCNGFPYVKVHKDGQLIIEDEVQINAVPRANAHVIAGSMTLFVAAGAKLRLGKGMGVSGTRIVAMKSIAIGSKTLIGAGCLICDSDMHEIPLGSPNAISIKPIAIGQHVFIGAQSIILKGVEIGDGSVIAAGSVVTKTVPSNSLAGGNTAKILRMFSQEEYHL